MALETKAREALNVLYLESGFVTGVKRYTEGLQAALQDQGVTVAREVLQGKEWKGHGGWLTTQLARYRKRGGLIHVIDPGACVHGAQVVTVHDLLHETNPEYFRHEPHEQAIHKYLVPRFMRKAKILLANSQVTKDEAREHWQVKNVRVIPHAIDHNRYYKDHRPPVFPIDSNPLFVYVGSDHPRKNLRLAIEAVESYHEDCRLVVIGPTAGPQRPGKPMGCHVEGRVTYTGSLQDTEIRRILSHASAFLWPSLKEGFGLPPLEAMACGLPVVALDSEINREVLGNDLPHYHSNSVLSMRLAMQSATEDTHDPRHHATGYTFEKTARLTRAAYEELT
jgi:glycosyltransferase involved in cell wall biosynthesis